MPPNPSPTPVMLFIGSIQALPDGSPSGIYKRAVATPVTLGSEGFADDAQADRRVHGGPEKAVHHFPSEHYANLSAQFPSLSGAFIRGALGENISTMGWTEENVHLGDVFSLGNARLQVSQPRSPCWKINAKFGVEDAGDDMNISRHVGITGRTGWYYRVIVPGTVNPDDALALVERPAHSISLAQLSSLWRDHRPPISELERLLNQPGLNAAWREKISRRLDWLRNRPEQEQAEPGWLTYHTRPD